MTNPPTDRTSATSGSWEPDAWDRERRDRRRVAVVSIAIVAVAVVASVLIIALGTGGDEPDPSAVPTGSADTAQPTGSDDVSAGPTDSSWASKSSYNWDSDDVDGAEGAPEDVVKTYIQALRDADIDAAIQVTCGGLYQEAANAKEQDLGVSQDFSDLSAPVTNTDDPSFPTPAPAKLVSVDWELGSDTEPRVFLAMVVDGAWKACEVGNEDQPPTPSNTDTYSS